MKRIVCLLMAFIIASQLFCQTKDTLVGKIVQVPNPCLNSPCLPGMVYALENDTSVFIISVGESWKLTDNPLIINDDTLCLNDFVEIIGKINYRKDINSEEYYEIEANTSNKLTATSIEQLSMPIVQVYPNPTNGKIHIYSKHLNISEVEIIDMSGQCVFNSMDMICNKSLVIENFTNKGVHLLKIKFEDNQVLINKILFQ